ncbi:MAG: insulinase family protein, partial [Deltaproteobacteria bacterium]
MTMSDQTPMLLVEDRGRAISTWILSLPVGALLDPPGKEGLAYLTGQMLLRGAGGMDQARFADELDYLGSTLSVGTGRERTTISGDALSRHLDDFEALVAAMLNEPVLDAEELEKLKRQTVAELVQVRDNDAALGQRFFLRRLFAGHPYGRPVKGTEASIPTIDIADVRAFYRERFVAGGALLGASGD